MPERRDRGRAVQGVGVVGRDKAEEGAARWTGAAPHSGHGIREERGGNGGPEAGGAAHIDVWTHAHAVRGDIVFFCECIYP